MLLVAQCKASGAKRGQGTLKQDISQDTKNENPAS